MNAEPAAPSRELKKLWREWIELHTILDKGISQTRPEKERPAAPFFAAVSKTNCKRRILFVGKATNHELDGTSYRKHSRKAVDDAIYDRLQANLNFVSDGGNGSAFRFARKKGNGSAFWTYFSRLESKFGVGSVIWSNIAKIGSLKDNPSGILLSAQADLAERTLRAEIAEYRPALIVFVTGSDPGLSRIINRALGVTDDDWIRSEKEDVASGVRDVWWLQRPHIALWTRHPQGAPKKQTTYWVKKARKLIGARESA